MPKRHPCQSRCVSFSRLCIRSQNTFSCPCFPYYTRSHTAHVTNLSFSQKCSSFLQAAVSQSPGLSPTLYLRPCWWTFRCFRLPFIINNMCLGLADGANGHGRLSRAEVYRGTAEQPSGLPGPVFIVTGSAQDNHLSTTSQCLRSGKFISDLPI